MHVAHMLVDFSYENGTLSLMDGYSGYNHIFTA